MAESIFIKYSDSLNEKNIQFLQGNQENVNKMMKGSGDPLEGTAKEGSFYLTQDTHRLYVGRKGVSPDTGVYPVAVNEGIATVNTVQDLPSNANQGEFYYIVSDNILAVRSGANWVQLNTDTSVSNLRHTINEITSNSDVIGATVHTKLGVNGVDAYDGSFKILEGSNIEISISTDNGVPQLTITADDTTYSIGTNTNANAGVIKFHNNSDADATNDQLITLTGANGSSVSSDNAGNITISGPSVTGNSITNRSGDNTGFRIETLVNGVATQGNAILDPEITYGVSGVYDLASAVSKKFKAGTTHLDVYTSSQTDKAIAAAIEDKFREADAMVYRGILTPGTDTVPTSQVQNGDTYKIVLASGVESATYATYTVKTGDLLIAKGTEATSGANAGYIPSDSISWDLIPAGDEPTYTGYLDTHGFNIKETVNSVEKASPIAGMKLAEGNKITLSDTATGKVREVTINHATTTRTDNIGSEETSTGYASDATVDVNPGISFFALDTSNTATHGIATDSYGHITGITGRKVTIKDTHAYLTSLCYDTSTPTGLVTGESGIAIKLHGKNSDNKTVNSGEKLVYKSNTLSFSSTTSGVVSEGTRAAVVNIELKWGSF